MVGLLNSSINIVMIKQEQLFWSRLETTSLEDTLIKLGKVRIFLFIFGGHIKSPHTFIKHI